MTSPPLDGAAWSWRCPAAVHRLHESFSTARASEETAQGSIEEVTVVPFWWSLKTTTRGSAAPTDDEPSIKVVVRVRSTVSRLVDGKDLWFSRRTAPDSIAVCGGWHPR